MTRPCFQCGCDNSADVTFCGNCGSALALNDFVSRKVREEIEAAIRDRDVLETDSAIKVFDRAWGWLKLAVSIAAVHLLFISGGVLWKISDWWSSVDRAKQSFAETASATKDEISKVSKKSLSDIQQASESAAVSSSTAAGRPTPLPDRLGLTSTPANARSAGEAPTTPATLRFFSFESARDQVAEALPFNAQQLWIKRANRQTDALVTPAVEVFRLQQPPGTRSLMMPPEKGGDGSTLVYFLLSSKPIQGTLQLRCDIFAEPSESYLSVGNLVIFRWQASAAALRLTQISASYFPDVRGTGIIHALSEKGGRVFADGEPLPRFNAPDSGFRGDRWFTPPPSRP